MRINLKVQFIPIAWHPEGYVCDSVGKSVKQSFNQGKGDLYRFYGSNKSRQIMNNCKIAHMFFSYADNFPYSLSSIEWELYKKILFAIFLQNVCIRK